MKLRALVACAGVVCVLAAGCATNKKWGKGAATGALIGGAIGGGGGAGVEWGRDMDEPEQLGRGAAVGAAAGMVIGGLIGHALWDESIAPPPPPPPPPTPAPAVEAPPPPPAKKIVLRAVHFDFNRAVIRGESAESLDAAAALLNENPDARVVVEGHTDAVGSEDYNRDLGRRRAEAVQRYLQEKGVDPARLTIRAVGEAEPVATNKTRDGRAQNRRVELKEQGGGM